MGEALYFHGTCEVCGSHEFRIGYDRKARKLIVYCIAGHLWTCPWPRTSIGEGPAFEPQRDSTVGEGRDEPRHVVPPQEAKVARMCLYCGEPFAAGGNGRRVLAKFCSDEHRKRFNSLARSSQELRAKRLKP